MVVSSSRHQYNILFLFMGFIVRLVLLLWPWQQRLIRSIPFNLYMSIFLTISVDLIANLYFSCTMCASYECYLCMCLCELSYLVRIAVAFLRAMCMMTTQVYIRLRMRMCQPAIIPHRLHNFVYVCIILSLHRYTHQQPPNRRMYLIRSDQKCIWMSLYAI